MENNGLSSKTYPGMLGLEIQLHPHQQQKNPPNPPHQLQSHPQMVAFAQQSVKNGYPYATKAKQQQQQQQQALSDEDEPPPAAGFTADDGDGKRKISPWQRMKWTDSMVKLLIMAVFYIGDEGGSDGGADAAGKKKAGGSGLLQKKGKWKSVSRAMMEKGFYVSPQQCEDKFNDLNKRYKRVNEILGKGTACRVVENQNLLETMDNLTPKMKEEVRKLLNSKHLFFREMCAYHNSCGGGGGGGGGSGGNGGGTAVHHSPEMAPEPSHHHQHQRCLHSPDNAAMAPNSGRTETEGSKMAKGGSAEEDDEDDEEEDEDEDEDEEEVVGGGGVRGLNENGHDEKDDENGERSSRKRQRKGISMSTTMPSPFMQQLSSEVLSLLQDGSKSSVEKKHWMRNRLMQLEEQRVSYQCQGFELEKQRLKWVRFTSKKERDMERAKLKNEQMKLENERMVLLLHQKELELLQLHQQQQISSNRRADPSSITG